MKVPFTGLSSNIARFLNAGKQELTPPHVKIEFALKMFVGIRGHECLKDPTTAVVMRENGECFITQDVANIDDSAGIKSLVYMRDLKSIDRFKKTFGDNFLRSSPLGQMALNEVADEIVRRITKK